MKFIFVDGYNVINSWSNLKSEKEISLDSARQKLIDILHNYGAIHQIKIMLIFDGYRVAGNLENKYEHNNSNQNGRKVRSKNTIIFNRT